MSKFDFDLITIGAGSGGTRASRLSASYGGKVAVIEESRVGGTCVMRGCVPKKLMVYGAQYAEQFDDAKGFGWNLGDIKHDWPTLVGNKNTELDRLEGIYHSLLQNAGVSLIEGRGVLADRHTVEVHGKSYTADKILTAVGGWPVIPQFSGQEHVITSNEALDLTERPTKIVIVGGGYIAVEFAGIFNGLGSEVHEVIRASNILRGFDDDIRDDLATEMEKKGVFLHRESLVQSVRPVGGAYSVTLDNGEELAADVVMYATGRAPNTEGIGLQEAGVSLNGKGAILVDQWNRSNIDNIFAVGDVTDRINLTPVAINEGRVFAETFFNNNPTILDYANVASAVFSQPPIGSVGLTEEEARKSGAVTTYMSRFRPLKHTISGRDECTTMKIVVDAETDKVLGCHMVGDDAPEIIQGVAIALKCGATKSQFDATVGIHPTAGEEFVTMREPISKS